MTHLVRITCLAAALLSIVRPASAQTARPEPAQPLTLDAAIALAIANNRDINASTHSVANADLAIATARSYRLPQFEVQALGAQSITTLGMDFPAGAFGVFPAIGPVPSVDTRVTSPRRPMIMAQGSITQPITQLFTLNLNIKSAAVGRDIEQERQRLTMQTTAAHVRKAYYGLLQVDASLRAAEAVLEASRALDGVVGQRVVQRVALKGDGLRSQLRVADALQNRLTLQNRRAERKSSSTCCLAAIRARRSWSFRFQSGTTRTSTSTS
jgi:outer membrane protein TolC